MALETTQRQRTKVTIDEYVHYHREGYVIKRGLLDQQDVDRLLKWTDDIYEGKINLDHLAHVASWMTEAQKTERIASARFHQPHRHDATAEWGILHPRVLDVLEGLIGPDVLALQSMLFFNPPGKGGQGWHQDAYYIQTQPNSLIGVWIALDRADEENGCLWVAPGSHHEPIYPPPQRRSGYVHADDRQIEGLFPANAVSVLDDEVNNLSKIAAKYGKAIPVVLEPGDVLFFHSHLLHRSYVNRTEDRFRRSYVTHYCNARSRVPWGFQGKDEDTPHILARGRTHLPYAKPKFGTPVELTNLPDSIESNKDMGDMMVATPEGDMGKLHVPEEGHKHN